MLRVATTGVVLSTTPPVTLFDNYSANIITPLGAFANVGLWDIQVG